MYVHNLPRALPQHDAIDQPLRRELVKALDHLAKFGTAAEKASFSLAMKAAALYANDAVEPSAIALSASACILNSTTEIDIWLNDQTILSDDLRAIVIAQFSVNNGGTVSAVDLVAPNVLRLTGTGYAAADVVSFTADADAKDVLRYDSWVAADTDATLGPAVATATLTGIGATVLVESATSILITLPFETTVAGQPLFGAFAVNNGGTVTAVAYPTLKTIRLTGTGYAAGDVVTYTAPGTSRDLLQVRPYKTYTVATGVAPAAS
jgi:hypothetical protein